MANPKILPNQVDAIDAPADGEALAYDNATGKFEWMPLGGSLDDLTDVILTGVAQNDFLVRGAAEWNNLTPALARTAIGLVAGGAGDIWVEKAGDTMTGQLFIDGSGDVIQLRVQAHSTQTSDLATWENSSGVKYVRITGDGKLIATRGSSTTSSNFFAGGAGNSTTTGDGANFGVGEFALNALTTGSQNFALGYGNMYRVTTARNNVSIGVNTLFYLVDGTGNIAIGHSSGYNLLQSNNTILGYLAGFTMTYGNDNIYIGAFAGYRQTVISGRLIVDNQLRASAAVEATNSIIYGTMAATLAGQALRINATVQTFGRKQAVVTKTANYAATVNDEVIRFTTSAPATLTLPAATGSGQTYTIIADGCTVTIDGNASETINNEVTQTLYDGDAAILHDVASGKWNIG